MDENTFQKVMNAFLSGIFNIIIRGMCVKQVTKSINRDTQFRDSQKTIVSIPDAFVMRSEPAIDDDLPRSIDFEASIEHKPPFGSLCNGRLRHLQSVQLAIFQR
jgi:hypothetical protein